MNMLKWICYFTRILLYVDKSSILHGIKETLTKTAEHLLEALMTAWISIHGPTQELIIDGETGVTQSQVMDREFKARGIKLTVRAVSQHARYIERRGALLRQTMRSIDDQLRRDGVTVSFAVLLA